MADVIDPVAENLAEAAPDAEQHGVTICLETHDAFCRGEEVSGVLRQIDSPYVKAVWNVHHPYRMGEAVEDTWHFIGARLAHVHMKDAQRREDGSWELMGEGEVPCREILDLIAARGYNGFICAQWEKKWHPEIDEPEIARVLREWMAGAGDRG